MIHVLDRQLEAQARVLRAMFAARKQIFVDLLGWDVPVINGQYEIDQFDDGDAVYIVIAGEDGAHWGSARLLKTTRPHILDTLFPQLCEGDVPRGDDIWEITRFCLDRALGARDRLKVRNQLVTAIAEHALASGIRRYTGVAELPWFQQILAFGWRCAPLGLPRVCERTTLAAVAIEIDDETPQLLADAGVYALPDVARLAAAWRSRGE